jgi:hypothetical protein
LCFQPIYRFLQTYRLPTHRQRISHLQSRVQKVRRPLTQRQRLGVQCRVCTSTTIFPNSLSNAVPEAGIAAADWMLKNAIINPTETITCAEMSFMILTDDVGSGDGFLSGSDVKGFCATGSIDLALTGLQSGRRRSRRKAEARR